MLQSLDLNALATEIHAANAHWWHDPATGERLDRNKGEMLMLIVSELSEAMEGERKDLMDDHLPHRKMAEVELADVLIRVFDFAGGWGYRLRHLMVREMAIENRGELLLRMVCRATKAYSWLWAGAGEPHSREVASELSYLISQVLDYAGRFGYDVLGAMAEKRAYNAQRADHKAAARLSPNGKKW